MTINSKSRIRTFAAAVALVALPAQAGAQAAAKATPTDQPATRSTRDARVLPGPEGDVSWDAVAGVGFRGMESS